VDIVCVSDVFIDMNALTGNTLPLILEQHYKCRSTENPSSLPPPVHSPVQAHKNSILHIFKKKSSATGGMVPRILPFAPLRSAFGKILLFLLPA